MGRTPRSLCLATILIARHPDHEAIFDDCRGLTRLETPGSREVVHGARSGGCAGALAVDEAVDLQGVGFLEFRREYRVRYILVADRAQEAEDGCGADGGGSAVGGGWERSAVDHRAGDLDAGGVAVEEDASDPGFEDGQEGGGEGKVFAGGVEGCGEVSVEMPGGGNELRRVSVADE